MSGSLIDQLEKFGDCLSEFCPAVYDKLQAGLSENEIASKLGSVHVNNKAIVELFQWRNGIGETSEELVGKYNVCSQGKLMPLDEAIAHYKTFTGEGLWGNDLFPVITNYGGDYLLFDFGKSNPTHEALLLYSPSLLLTTPETAYNNLDYFIETVIECFEKGIYKFDVTDAYLEVDYDAEAKLSAEKNPRATMWL